MSDRFDGPPDWDKQDVITFFKHLDRTIEYHSYDIHRRNGGGSATSQSHGTHISSDTSPMKKHYGDEWLFINGLMSAVAKIEHTAANELGDGRSLNAYREHYEKFGHGEYGKGLEVGKSIALRNFEDNFDLSAGGEDGESNFQFSE